MKPVDQTTFGSPGGNCFSACVASLLEIPIEEVPYFMDGGAWFERFAEWLRPRGYWPLCFKSSRDGWTPAGLHILSGKSPRELANPNALHSVVAHGGEIEHDPHPSRAGILTRDDFVILVPIDPARGAQR